MRHRTDLHPRSRGHLAARAIRLGLATALLAAGCSKTITPVDSAPAQLTPEQKRRAEQLINLFEWGTTEIQYGLVERLGDGRGITAGRAGFTSATGDLLEVVELYTKRAPSNPLAVYLPVLRRLAKDESDDTRGLENFESAWARAALDPAFRAAQDEVVDIEYYQPALEHATEVGLHSALAVAEVYDAIIQHGDGDDPDGLGALLERTRTATRGTPRTGADERAWLRAFIATRRATLLDPSDPDTRDAWAESTGRCDIFLTLLESGNLDLHGPIVVRTDEYQATIP